MMCHHLLKRGVRRTGRIPRLWRAFSQNELLATRKILGEYIRGRIRCEKREISVLTRLKTSQGTPGQSKATGV
jgi:hypothetical protein